MFLRNIYNEFFSLLNSICRAETKKKKTFGGRYKKTVLIYLYGKRLVI